jgi:hypothetical protein
MSFPVHWLLSHVCGKYFFSKITKYHRGLPWSWSYNYLFAISVRVRIPLMRAVLDTTSRDKVCQWLAAGRLFAPGTPVSSTNKTDRHDITEILLKVALSTITLTPNIIISTYSNNNKDKDVELTWTISLTKYKDATRNLLISKIIKFCLCVCVTTYCLIFSHLCKFFYCVSLIYI